MELNTLLDKLSATQAQYNKARETADRILQDVNALKEEVHIKLNELGLRSARNEDYTVTIASRRNYVITNEQDVINWLKEQPNLELDMYIGVKKKELDVLNKHLEKTTGEIPTGVEPLSKEYISLRKAKKDD